MDPAEGRVRFTPAHRGGTGVLATAAGRRRASALITENADHLPADLLEHVVMGTASVPARPVR